jgi:hypothetical protein
MFLQSFLVGAVYFSEMYFLPIYYQSVWQMDLMTSAALIVPLVITQSIGSASSGQYIARMGRYGEVIWFGFFLWIIGAGLHCTFDRDTPVVAIVFVLIVTGFGVGCVFQPSKFESYQRQRQHTNIPCSARCCSGPLKARGSCGVRLST